MLRQRVAARHRSKAVAVACLVCLVLLYRHCWYDISSPVPYTPWSRADYGGSWMPRPNASASAAASAAAAATWTLPPVPDGKPAYQRTAQAHADAALQLAYAPPGAHSLGCPAIRADRYRDLLLPAADAAAAGAPTRAYFFALDLCQVVDLLPTLMAALLEALRFLGPANCVVSIVEGRSTDGTYETLLLLARMIEALGAVLYLQRSGLNPRVGDRIGKLAKLRNLALEPMHLPASNLGPGSTVVFVNDVALCAEDLLELALQRRRQRAAVACAMDYHRLARWAGGGGGPLAFYDVWVARGMDGETFYNVAPGEGTRHAADLFPGDPTARRRFAARQPLQVFACWNGAVAIDAQPFLDRRLEFRRAQKRTGECAAGEPTLLCKDLWRLGRGRVLLVPSVSVAYSVEEGRLVKQALGYTADWTANATAAADAVVWDPHPPDAVRCIPSWRKQFWQAWDYGLEELG